MELSLQKRFYFHTLLYHKLVASSNFESIKFQSITYFAKFELKSVSFMSEKGVSGKTLQKITLAKWYNFRNHIQNTITEKISGTK